MIELIDLNIGYKTKGVNQVILNNINAAFHRGELIGLAGNNGSGKSTLLKTLSGFLPALKGKIVINGTDISQLSSHTLSQLLSVVLTDKLGGYNLTVYDVVACGRIPYLNSIGNLSDEDAGIVNESLSTIGIAELKDKLFEELSDGQKQKVLIAKSLAQQTPVILMDEPTAFLDYESRVNLFKLLRQLSQDKSKLIIISSHEIDILFRNADKVFYTYPDGNYKYDFPTKIREELML
jgi:iron complex transport system ATP-binding protein